MPRPYASRAESIGAFNAGGEQARPYDALGANQIVHYGVTLLSHMTLARGVRG